MSKLSTSIAFEQWKQHPLTRSLGLGILAGMRVMTAPTWVACSKNARAERLLAAFTALEMVVDKLPITPPRIVPAQISARTVSGAASAAYGNQRPHAPAQMLGYAVIGGVTAFAVGHAAYRLRRYLVKELELPDTVVGLAEDALNFALGALLFKPTPGALASPVVEPMWNPGPVKYA